MVYSLWTGLCSGLVNHTDKGVPFSKSPDRSTIPSASVVSVNVSAGLMVIVTVTFPAGWVTSGFSGSGYETINPANDGSSSGVGSGAGVAAASIAGFTGEEGVAGRVLEKVGLSEKSMLPLQEHPITDPVSARSSRVMTKNLIIWFIQYNLLFNV